MAKFNIAVELDWMDEEYNLDEEIKNTIVNGIVDRVQDRLVRQVDSECNNKINSQMANIEKAVSDKLNGIMDSFFDEPRDVTDRYGDVIKKGVTVRDTLKKACDDFMNQSLDKDGKPTTSSYCVKYPTRVDYIVAKSIDFMYNPCFECYNRSGHSYVEECDNTCLYANDIKNRNAALEYLLDMLEEEHMGMRAVAVKEIADKFDIEL